MPSVTLSDDENAPAKHKTAPNLRRAPATRTPRNGGTPIRKADGNKTSTPKAPAPKARMPNSAAANVRKVSKKAEPTLLQDFFLGRPSPHRTGAGARRKSLDAVKRDMKLEADVIGKVPTVGGVKDRVKQWQKASAAELAAIKVGEEKVDNESEPEDDKANNSGGESNPRPGRRKGKEEEGQIKNGGAAKGLPNKRGKSATAPKKRVISDDHWMKTPEKKTTTPRKGQPIPKNFAALTNNPPLEQKIKDWTKRNAAEDSEEVPSSGTILKQEETDTTPRKEATVPENFLTATINPPLARKIDDWIQRSVDVEHSNAPKIKKENSQETEEDSPIRSKVSRQESSKDITLDEEDTRRRKKTPRQEQANNAQKSSNSSRRKPPGDSIRVNPSPNPEDDGIRIRPFKGDSVNPGDDDARNRPGVSKNKGQEKHPAESRNRHEKSYKERKRSYAQSISGSNPSGSGDSDYDNVDNVSWTPSRTHSKRHQRKSDTLTESLAEIPLGNSAFSVLDLPVGAEAGTIRRHPPKRTPSFTVPKVLKKVYNEARNMVHDTVDPTRAGMVNPLNIESWLNGTFDPFVDHPAAPKSKSEIPESPARGISYESNDAELGRKQPVQSRHSMGDRDRLPNVESEPPNARETFPSMEHSPSISPIGLKRSPATRNTSSPKSARKTPLKEALLDAFRGESSTTQRSKSMSPADMPELRGNRSPQEFKSVEGDILNETPPKRTPPTGENMNLKSVKEEKQFPLLSKRLAPTTGAHRLSTIASVETFSTGSSTCETASEISQTTVTQDTQSSLPTESSLSQSSNKSVLKRRLTKHSDLLSVLSLPDPAEPGRVQRIKPGRSMRTSRVRLETATIRGLMQELAGDETKYMRELNTLVDGVIPVLLSSVLSKSESAIAAGLFDTNPGERIDASYTKPIVAMGVALERLRSLHKRIPLGDPEALTSWAHGAHKTYDDYLSAWRMGFQDVIVNLAPALRSASQAESTLDTMPRNAAGDVVNADGERVDVAFLLKRPFVRVKYLSKIWKGIDKLKPTDLSHMVNAIWEDLELKGRRRAKEEGARMVDRAANNIDPTRARNPRTLALVEDSKIDRSRQVCAKDYFSLDMPHSSGQRIECRVELLLRDKPSDKNDDGDVLVCAVDDVSRWLLFTPLSKSCMSARLGDTLGQVVILVRGIGDSGKKWQEIFLLETDDYEAAAEWIEMLGSVPKPPEISSVFVTESQIPNSSTEDTRGVEIPIGERRRREAEEVAVEQPEGRRRRHIVYNSVDEGSVGRSTHPKDLNDAMRNAGQIARDKYARARYHTPVDVRQQTARLPHSSGSTQSSDTKDSSIPSSGAFMSGALPPIPKVNADPARVPENPMSTSPPKEFKKQDEDITNPHKGTISPPDHDDPPPPPAHRVPTTPNKLKKAQPALGSPIPRAKNRRTSSPLKHEYQPSNALHSEGSDLSGDDSSSDTDEELEGAELPGRQISPPVHQRKRVTRSASSNPPSYSPEQSNFADQTPSSADNNPQLSATATRLTAMISSWDSTKGAWEDLHHEPCSIVVSPGLVEAFVLSASHSLPQPNTAPDSPCRSRTKEGTNRPLVALEITPFVKLRKSTVIDIEIQSTPTSDSQLKCTGTVRYRSITVPACTQLYNAIHKSRMETPAFLELEQERIVGSYGTHAYEATVAGSRRRSFFGRQRSYRASTRAPSSVELSEQSHSSSAFSRLRRMSGGGLFNIAKSSIDNGARRGNFWSAASSAYGGSRYSGVSGHTPPGTPPSLSQANTTASKDIANLGNENLKVRLYALETVSKWDDKGHARLTISQPLPGMRQASFLNNGVEKRIIVSIKAGKGDDEYAIVLDEVLGSGCFSRVGRTGIAINIWEDIKGDRGEIGQIGRIGGVSGRIRKWLLQTGSAREAGWIFGLTQRSALSY